MAKVKAFELIGADDLSRAFASLTDDVAETTLRQVIQGAATEMAKRISQRAPRASGRLAKQFYAKRNRVINGQPSSEVRARPDGYYWRFLEHGTQGSTKKNIPPMQARHFVRDTWIEFKDEYPDMLRRSYLRYMTRRAKRIAKGGK